MPIEGKFLRLSEHMNALDYLEKAQRFLYEADEDCTAWKWVIISLHGALYGFAVCALEQGNVLNVIKGNRKSAMDKLKKGTARLVSFWEVLRRCQDPAQVGNARALQLSRRQKESLDTLVKLLRNEFEHFIPKGWSIELHGMPQIAIHTLEIIGFLALRTGCAIHLDDVQKQTVQDIVRESKGHLENSELFKEAQATETNPEDDA